MEINAIVVDVLAVRKGVSQKGNQWMALPIVVKWCENGNERNKDFALLELMDEKDIKKLSPYLKKGADGKAVVDDKGRCELTKEVDCIVGFAHSVREWEGKVFNSLRVYRFDLSDGFMAQEPVQAQAAPAVAAPSEEEALPF